MFDEATALGLAAALGGGLLIGLERERRKPRQDGRAAPQAAGIRSFALVALGGGLAQASGLSALVALGALLVVALAVLGHWDELRSLRELPASSPPAADDPGLTTELALFVTYLIGVLCVTDTALGVGAAVVVAVLLAARDRLHRFATQALSEGELHDALVLAALALVLLPLAPAEPPAALAGWVPVAPRTLLLTVVLILALQAAGHVAGRLLGARLGLALSGLFSGFVSSTATIVAMGGRVRAALEGGASPAGPTAAALLSTVATWIQVLLLVAALAPASLPRLLPVALAGAAVSALVALALLKRLRGAASGEAEAPRDHGPLRVREALIVATLLAVVAVGVAAAERHFGALGLLGGTALAALADAHAPVAALASLQSAGQIGPALVLQGSLLAVGANSCSRSVAAFAAGGRAYGLVVAATLAASWAVAALTAWVIG